MARKPDRRRRKNTGYEEFPGWIWMLFGLAIGLSVALAIYLQDHPPSAPPSEQGATPSAPAPAGTASAPAALDENGESAPAAEPPPQRFDFYNMLPNFEVVIPEQESDVTTDTEPRAVEEPGVYVLQAGSFSRYEDADRRRAQLALQGIESTIQRVGDRRPHVSPGAYRPHRRPHRTERDAQPAAPGQHRCAAHPARRQVAGSRRWPRRRCSPVARARRPPVTRNPQPNRHRPLRRHLPRRHHPARRPPNRTFAA
ncbi:MAG: SPOR domain-containing protein [Woeseiaceae bacterium]|nr:SPOR domain-containing protein [Woeseiaceae bacterium]